MKIERGLASLNTLELRRWRARAGGRRRKRLVVQVCQRWEPQRDWSFVIRGIRGRRFFVGDVKTFVGEGKQSWTRLGYHGRVFVGFGHDTDAVVAVVQIIDAVDRGHAPLAETVPRVASRTVGWPVEFPERHLTMGARKDGFSSRTGCSALRGAVGCGVGGGGWGGVGRCVLSAAPDGRCGCG